LEDPLSCPDCGGELSQDPDVLDTWFSSGLWPFSTMGWPVDTPELRRYYPTSVLVTGFDIIFFWVARMMMLGIKVMGQAPFRDVVLHPLVRDAQGQKMSKSKGNVIDPLTIIDRFGADAFRFTLASQAGTTRDIKLSEDRVAGYSRFVNKLWNAARFTLGHLSGYRAPSLGEGPSRARALPDRWIRSRLLSLTQASSQALDEYHFDRLADGLYHFIWDEFCDWYLELIKPILYGSDREARALTVQSLGLVFSDILKLMHPVMPFLTEELWSRLPGAEGLLIGAPWPEGREGDLDREAEAQIAFLMGTVKAARTARSDFRVPLSSLLSPVVAAENQALAALLTEYAPLLLKLMGAKSLRLAEPGEIKPRDAAVSIHDWGQVWIPLSGHIDLEAEKLRLAKESGHLEKDIKAARAKLSNPDYLKKAPEDIVEETRLRLSSLEKVLEGTRRSISLLSGLAGADGGQSPKEAGQGEPA
jgi:valyl-tRNA synthetase